MSSSTRSIVSTGADGTIVEIECHASNNLPTIVVTGLANRAVHEARDRLRGAFANSGLKLPRKRLTINLAPADIPKVESSLDLAIAVAILACDRPQHTLNDSITFIGELGLDGSVRPVRGLIGKLLAGKRHSICSYFVPAANIEQGMLVPGITLYPVAKLQQLADHLGGKRSIAPIKTGHGASAAASNNTAAEFTIDDIVGQAAAKRAIVIAAAGGHNVLLNGPPGTGKSMLAKALPGLVPAMTQSEILEVTHLNSLASNNYEQLSLDRPIRSPHHSVNVSAMIGGGRYMRPGEISLSHHGVLLLDEFPEFSRASLEALRQPLEDREVCIARASDSVRYPARFMLIATANPCPCGYYGFNLNRCSCSEAHIKRYKNKLSGPIMDRIDLCSDVHTVDHKRLLQPARDELTHVKALQMIATARAAQAERLTAGELNSDLSNRQLRSLARLNRRAIVAIQDAAHSLQLSARAYFRTIKVARTIADLEGLEVVDKVHIAEALAYRQRQA